MSDRLAYFDCETTGSDPYTDRIVEIAIQSSDGAVLSTRMNPGVPIPAEVTAIHGITDDDVKDAPTFDVIAERVQDLLTGAVLVGYCCRTFDTILVDAELQRAGQPGFPRDTAGRIVQPEIDLYQVWLRHEDRKLVTAARRFAGVDLTDAHAADADTSVLPEVLRGMCNQFGIDAGDVEGLCALSIPEGVIDRDGKFRKREDGVIVFTFGKHKDEPVDAHPDFIRWMLSKDFSPETKDIGRALMQRALRRSA